MAMAQQCPDPEEADQGIAWIRDAKCPRLGLLNLSRVLVHEVM
jgi:hypothetical protein